MKAKRKQPESVADFKQRIAIMMRERETGKKFSIVGGPRTDECLVRKNKRRWEKRHGKAGHGELSRCNIFCD
jgi:hypothetical protein